MYSGVVLFEKCFRRGCSSSKGGGTIGVRLKSVVILGKRRPNPHKRVKSRAKNKETREKRKRTKAGGRPILVKWRGILPKVGEFYRKLCSTWAGHFISMAPTPFANTTYIYIYISLYKYVFTLVEMDGR
jgi:hypothetical protein